MQCVTYLVKVLHSFGLLLTLKEDEYKMYKYQYLHNLAVPPPSVCFDLKN